MDITRIERIRRTAKLGEISKEVQENRLKCYKQKRRRICGERLIVMEVSGKKRGGITKRVWLDSIMNDL